MFPLMAPIIVWLGLLEVWFPSYVDSLWLISCVFPIARCLWSIQCVCFLATRKHLSIIRKWKRGYESFRVLRWPQLQCRHRKCCSTRDQWTSGHVDGRRLRRVNHFGRATTRWRTYLLARVARALAVDFYDMFFWVDQGNVWKDPIAEQKTRSNIF